jgi:hypothetical protein
VTITHGILFRIRVGLVSIFKFLFVARTCFFVDDFFVMSGLFLVVITSHIYLQNQPKRVLGV